MLLDSVESDPETLVPVVPRQYVRFTADRPFWTVIEVSREVLGRAEALCTTHPLRALDAIHVASAQLFRGRVGSSGFTFVSANVRQTATTAALQIPTRQIEA